MPGPVTDDLDALVPPPPGTVVLGGQALPLPVLTLARYARARRFARAFVPVLTAGDVIEALEAEHAALVAAFSDATEIAPAAVEAADVAEQLGAFFALVRLVRDFTAGPLAATLADGWAAMLPAAGRATAPDGVPSSPGSSGADTA